MVTLIQPRSTERYYIQMDETLLGPFDAATNSFAGDRIELPVPEDSIYGARGIYHENFVEHVKTDGTFRYHPDYYNSTPAPTLSFPNRMLVPFGSGTNKIYANAGFAIGDQVAITKVAGVVRQYLWKDLTGEGWVFYTVISTSTSPSRVQETYKTTVKPLGKSSFYWKCSVTKERNVQNPRPYSSCDWDKPQTPEIYFQEWSKVHTAPGSKTTSTTTQYYFYDYVRRTSQVNNTVLWEALYHVSQIMPQKDLKPDEAHYGDLAMKASEKVNATRINVIAFLRDLRDPKSLIPKLKNLGSLKGLSDNYLTVKYGILPTISDIQNIVASLERLKPYLDRNGFEILTAGHTASKTLGNVMSKVEQHVKLAIGVEDNGMEALIEGLERFGSFPTFEYIWDLIPYSFVIDWLVDVGGFLERVDTHLRLIRLNIKYVTMSRKFTTQLSGWMDAEHSLFGNMTRVQYHRWVSDQCPVPPLSLQTTLTSFNHWLESSALLIQRAK